MLGKRGTRFAVGHRWEFDSAARSQDRLQGFVDAVAETEIDAIDSPLRSGIGMAAQMMSSSDHRSGLDAIAPLGPAALSIQRADPAGDLVQDLRSALNGTSDITQRHYTSD